MLPRFLSNKAKREVTKTNIKKLSVIYIVRFQSCSSMEPHVELTKKNTHLFQNYHSNQANGRFHPQPMIKKVDLKMCPIGISEHFPIYTLVVFCGDGRGFSIPHDMS